MIGNFDTTGAWVEETFACVEADLDGTGEATRIGEFEPLSEAEIPNRVIAAVAESGFEVCFEAASLRV